MNEQFLLGLAVAGLIAVGIVARMASGERPLPALSRLEAKLDALLKHEGIQFDPYSDVPPPVIDALRRGKKIEAIKEYRAATGVGLREAKDYVEELQRRAIPRA
jgi:Ribosomal protein L7/L12 C-terminal domain